MSDKKRIVVVGGTAAGPKAAARASRINPDAEITILQKSSDLSMASCGYPYYVGGFFDNRNALLSTPTGVVRDTKFYLNAKGIKAKVNTEVTRIDRDNKQLHYRDTQSGVTAVCSYDTLILATGSVPKMPPVPGIELDGITTLQSMEDADLLRQIRDEKKIKKAVVIGGGLIGIETCEALRLADIEITVIETLPQLLPFLDSDLAKLVENHIRSTGTNVITNNGVARFLGKNGKLSGVKLENGTELDCELAVVAVGIRPNTTLAEEAGLDIGDFGGIKVNEFMQTSDPDIYAAGDCVEVPHRISQQNIFAPYGDLANLEGRVAGENAAAGNHATFPGTLQTGICKVFSFTAGTTGLSEKAAKEAGFHDTISVVNASPDKPGFMGGKLLVTKLVADKTTGRILGAQCVGAGDVSRQISQWAMAIQGEMTVDDMVNADLPYAPPFSLAIDHGIATAHILQNKMAGLFTGISNQEMRQKLDNQETPFILDARGPDEFEEMRLGIGETLIPLGALRGRMNELPEDRDKEIICFCKISLRGYEAAIFLQNKGYNNVKVLEGGVMAWPYPREK